MDLSGRVALVTGASRGIGAAIAVALAEAGCDVACAARSTAEKPGRIGGTLDDTVQRVEGTGRRALAVPTDLQDDDSVAAMVTKTFEHFGRLDLLVNNAGRVDFGDLDIELRRYDKTMAVNLRAPLIATQAFEKVVDPTKGAAIVNISSLAAVLAQPGGLAYGIAKAGLERLSVDAARILAEKNVQVNGLRIDLAVASDGFVANTPGMDHSAWEPAETAAEAVMWILAQPEPYTGEIVSLFDLRSRGLLASAQHADTTDPVPPQALVTGSLEQAKRSAAAWSA